MTVSYVLLAISFDVCGHEKIKAAFQTHNDRAILRLCFLEKFLVNTDGGAFHGVLETEERLRTLAFIPDSQGVQTSGIVLDMLHKVNIAEAGLKETEGCEKVHSFPHNFSQNLRLIRYISHERIINGTRIHPESLSVDSNVNCHDRTVSNAVRRN